MTDAGAGREQVEDGVTGYVLEKNNMDGFVKRLIDPIENPEKCNQMVKAGRERWRKLFRVEDAAKKYADVYCAMASKE